MFQYGSYHRWQRGVVSRVIECETGYRLDQIRDFAEMTAETYRVTHIKQEGVIQQFGHGMLSPNGSDLWCIHYSAVQQIKSA
jgi:hypothetical protein